ncbi:MAG: nucleotidyltransferase domain-containing protein, partial [Candidatus Jordarchaeaceae archaeon]
MREGKTIMEGDFVEDKNDLIFDVKGLVHPPDRVVAYLRYYPDGDGERIRKNGKRYRKVYSLGDREEYLQKHFPGYIYFDPVFGVKLEGVLRTQISKIYKPVDRLRTLLKLGPSDDLEKNIILFVETLQEETGISLGKVGVSGSVLVDLAKPDSDIDIIVYGEKNCREAYEAVRNLFSKKNSPIRQYNEGELRRLYEFRVKDTLMDYKDFLLSEKRKCFSGKIEGRDFFIRFLKEPNEISEKYGDIKYVSLNNVRIEGIVLDDEESIFT